MQEKKRGRTHSRWLLPAALVLAGAAWFENFTLSTSTVTAACAALPEAFSGLRIVQISDLHGRRFDAESRYLLELVRLMSTNPANLLRLPGGTLREGSFADIVLFDPNLEWTVDAQQLHSKSRNTPFDKMKLTGRVVKTILGGKVVYEL